jgi:hypothetical protein
MKQAAVLVSILLVAACGRGPEGTVAGDCEDGVDNDGSGKVDCEDEGCAIDSSCLERERRARESERSAAEARARAEAEQRAGVDKAAELPWLELDTLLVQRGHNGADIAQAPAADYCRGLVLADKDGWRLPTEDEAVRIARSGLVAPEAFAMWTSTMVGRKRGIIVGITSAAANDLGTKYDGECRARCVRDR